MNLSEIGRALTETKVELADVRPALWNSQIDALSYDAQSEKHRSAILE
jgi:hypothetical protein